MRAIFLFICGQVLMDQDVTDLSLQSAVIDEGF